MKNNISLDNRLLSIANKVDPCDIVADVGTDHGLIPIYLILNNKANKVYACDVAIMPLEKAKENIARYNLEDKIIPILSDGFDKLDSNIDTIVIAGMGGHLVSSILNNSDKRFNKLIIQANSHCEVVRKALSELHYHIYDEEVIYVKGKYYEIICAKFENSPALSELEIKYGPINLIKHDAEFINMYKERLIVLENLLNNSEINKSQITKISDEANELKQILK